MMFPILVSGQSYVTSGLPGWFIPQNFESLNKVFPAEISW
jgi:hypothetical protein